MVCVTGQKWPPIPAHESHRSLATVTSTLDQFTVNKSMSQCEWVNDWVSYWVSKESERWVDVAVGVARKGEEEAAATSSSRSSSTSGSNTSETESREWGECAWESVCVCVCVWFIWKYCFTGRKGDIAHGINESLSLVAGRRQVGSYQWTGCISDNWQRGEKEKEKKRKREVLSGRLASKNEMEKIMNRWHLARRNRAQGIRHKAQGAYARG